VADMRALPGSESVRVDAAGGAGGLSLDCWAGGLSGFAAGFHVCRPSKGFNTLRKDFELRARD
jgi:hypothetical protein